MNRPGSFVADGNVSSRVYVTEPAATLAFVEMNRRPVPVATHKVLVSLGARSIAETQPTPALHAPSRSAPYAGPVRSVEPGAPIWTKSPHPGWFAGVVNSGQLASRVA